MAAESQGTTSKRWLAPRLLDDVCRGRDNNLNLMRFLAAVGVIYGHAFGVPGRDAVEPIHRVFGLGAGDLGVDTFFFISGFLICKSFLSRSLAEYAWARFVRIFPGLWVSSLFLVIVAGLFFSPLPAFQFWLRHDTVTYLLHNATMVPGFGAQQALPYALDTKIELFNAPLWTLPHELQMYMLLALIGVVGGLKRPFAVAAVSAIGAGMVVARKLFGVHLLDVDRARFLYFFFAGACVYLTRKHVVLSLRGLLVCLGIVGLVVAVTGRFDLRQGALVAVLPYLLLWMAYVPGGFLRRFNQLGDYSYGIYVYAFPIQVYLFGTQVGAASIPNFLIATSIVLPIAVASWHLLEKQALRLPLPTALARLTRRKPSPAA